MITRKPETLMELLKTLERSGDLRSLARECGLSVRELRRRLSIWRREITEDEALELVTETAPEKQKISKPRKEAAKKNPGGDPWSELPAASTLAKLPLPAKGKFVMEIFTDGASRGNPGPASIGILFKQKDGLELAEHFEAIGWATNNVAEYRAVVSALEYCQRWRIKRVHLNMDSELIVRQLHGTYRVKSPDLRPLYQQVVFLSKGLDEFRVRHIKRALNGHADALANRALDAG